MKPFYLAALAFGLAACDRGILPTDPVSSAPPPSLAAQATEHSSERRATTFDVTSPCTGGLIHFTIELFAQLTAVGPQELLDQGAALHVEYEVIISGTGTDPVTGTTYFLQDRQRLAANSPTLEAPNFTLTFQEMIHAISRGAGENFLIHVLDHVTVLPSGEMATTIEVESATCQG